MKNKPHTNVPKVLTTNSTVPEDAVSIEQFNFDTFLMEKGFSFTNYGSHNLYEIEKEEQHFAINLQGSKMTTNDTLKGTLLVDIDAPKDFKSAEKWLNGFLGNNVKPKSEK